MEGVAVSPHLTHLYLSKCDVTDKGLAVVGATLANNPALRSLDLSLNGFTGAGIVHLARGVCACARRAHAVVWARAVFKAVHRRHVHRRRGVVLCRTVCMPVDCTTYLCHKLWCATAVAAGLTSNSVLNKLVLKECLLCDDAAAALTHIVNNVPQLRHLGECACLPACRRRARAATCR